jgi:hypothetical protein
MQSDAVEVVRPHGLSALDFCRSLPDEAWPATWLLEMALEDNMVRKGQMLAGPLEM